MSQPAPAPGWTQPYVPRTNGLAIASLVLGVLFCLIDSGILAVVFGNVALGQIARSEGRQKGRGLAIGLVVALIAYVVMYTQQPTFVMTKESPAQFDQVRAVLIALVAGFSVATVHYLAF